MSAAVEGAMRWALIGLTLFGAGSVLLAYVRIGCAVVLGLAGEL